MLARLAPLAGLATLVLAGCSGSGGGDGSGPGPTVSIQPGAAGLCVGDSVVFTAQVLDGSGSPVSSPQIAWSSSAPQVASIDPARGVARALATGTALITASYGGAVSPAATLDVPSDLLPEFVPDSAVLAPGDTMTLGVRLRRASSGPVPAHLPAITPADGPVASLSAAGLVTAKAPGRASLSLAACGQQGGGAVDVFTPPDSLTGMGYLWLSGRQEVRVHLPARLFNFTRTSGGPGLEISSIAGLRQFGYVDTTALSGIGTLPLDSLNSSEVHTKLECVPPRPFALYADNTNAARVTSVFSLQGGSARITSYAQQGGYAAVSGRLLFQVRGLVNGQLAPGGAPDTLAAIYTFSAPLVDTTNACP